MAAHLIEVTASHTHGNYRITHGHFHTHNRAEYIEHGRDCTKIRHSHHADAYDAANGIVSPHRRHKTTQKLTDPMMDEVHEEIQQLEAAMNGTIETNIKSLETSVPTIMTARFLVTIDVIDGIPQANVIPLKPS